MFEKLENRRLLASNPLAFSNGETLFVFGTDKSEAITLDYSSSQGGFDLAVRYKGGVIGWFKDETIDQVEVDLGGGADTFFVIGSEDENINVYGGSGDDNIGTSDGDDEVDGGGGNDVIYGLGGDDRLVGDIGSDVLNGGDGDDDLRGGSGNDILNGENGDDDLRGEAGNDLLLGGSGDDFLSGGAGYDQAFGNGGGNSTDGSNEYLSL